MKSRMVYVVKSVCISFLLSLKKAQIVASPFTSVDAGLHHDFIGSEDLSALWEGVKYPYSVEYFIAVSKISRYQVFFNYGGSNPPR